jgi:hypothetical protein
MKHVSLLLLVSALSANTLANEIQIIEPTSVIEEIQLSESVDTTDSAAKLKLPANFSITGFAYATEFGDSDWHNGRSVAAVNMDWHQDNWAVRTQVSSYRQQHIRRAVVEYSHPIGENVEMVYQAGRFSRLESFYEGITDSPANYKQAIMPFGGYSYRMFNGAFVIMDGVQAQATFKLPDDYLLKFRAADGRMTIPSQNDIQKEAFRRTYDGVRINSNANNYDWAAALESVEYKWYVSRNRYLMNVDTDNSNATANNVSNTYNMIDYRLDKAGVRWDNQKYVAQLEWFHDITNIWRKARTLPLASNNDAIGFNWMIGKYIDDNWSVYTGRSYGRNKVAYSHNEDNYVGATWAEKSVSVSVELHRGHGFAWRKYDAPTVTAPEVPHWNTWVTSVSYRF